VDKPQPIFVHDDGSASVSAVPVSGAGAGSSGPRDPVLDEEPAQHVPGSFLEALPQFFVFPLILVGTLTVAYLGLRLLVGFDGGDARELIADIRGAGGPHARWQAMHGLADGLRRGRLTLDGVPSAELAELYADLGSEPGPDGAQTRQFLLEVLQWKKAPELTAIATGALADDDAGVRLSALYALAQMQDPAAVGALTELLEQGSSEERFVALGALALTGTPEARDAIATQVGGGDTMLHRNAVLALAQAGDARAVPHLPALLRRAGYEGDARLDGPDAALKDEASRLAAREDVIEQFLVNAARASAKLDPAAAASVIPLLRELRRDDPSLKVRSAAINALHDLGVPEESP